MIEDYLKDDTIIITSSSNKMEILESISRKDKFFNIKFMTKEEFFSEYFFSYDERAYVYLQDKYYYHLDVCKIYLKNLYFIEDKNYKNEKLQKLKALKEELEEQGLLLTHPFFRRFLKNKKIIVYQYGMLEKYEKEVLESLGALFLVDDGKYELPKVMMRAKSMEDEVVYVASTICSLISNGVDVSHIHLVHVTDDYFYSLKRIFSYFQIPLQNITTSSLFGTEVVSRYLTTGEICLEDTSSINKQFVQVVNSLSYLEEGESKKNILIDKLKHTSISLEKLDRVVSISSLLDIFTEDDHVFLMGANQDLFPKLYVDDDYILDKEKREVSLYTTDYKNKMVKEESTRLLKRIPHLYLSYKLESAFGTFYPSHFLTTLGIKDLDICNENYHYSHSYNKLLLAEGLDDYYKFGVVQPALSHLYETYRDIPYHTYDSSFTGVDKKRLKEYLQPVLKLSYTHLQNYYLCGFKYYVNHILRIDPFESNFSSVIGNMFHEALKYMYCEDFDLDYFMAQFLEANDYSARDQFFLRFLKEEFKKTIDTIYHQKEYTKFSDTYLEKTLEVPLRGEDLSIVLKGTIDKIMYYRNVSDTFYAVIDYKSGSYDTNLKKIRFGLNMQLPIYLYLIEKARLFPNSIFTGFYYQKILSAKKTYDKERDTLKLEGYSCDDSSVLELFDNSYQKSDIIKGLAVKQSGEFYASSKVLNSDEVSDLLYTVEEKVEEAKKLILNGDFSINPKYLEKENISCKYCEYHDLCFMKDKDLVYLTLEEE